jgi:Na+/melibiose symporter-like transporter
MAKSKLKDTIAEIRAREQEEGRLSVKEYVSYALAQFGFGSLGVMSGGYLMQFYVAIGIAVDKAGALMAASRVWDMVNDPIIATVIDKGKGRTGKFSRWLAPPCALFRPDLYPDVRQPAGGQYQR